jgi:hypothetical protein
LSGTSSGSGAAILITAARGADLLFDGGDLAHEGRELRVEVRHFYRVRAFCCARALSHSLLRGALRVVVAWRREACDAYVLLVLLLLHGKLITECKTRRVLLLFELRLSVGTSD